MVQRRWKKLGEILISQNLITNRQLAQGLEEHQRTGVSLGAVLVDLGYISQDDLTAVLGEQIQLSQRKPLGEILLEQGLLTSEKLEKGLTEHRQSGEQLGRCLTRLGFMSEDKLVGVLSAQLDVQHVMLEHYVFDPGLLKVIPEEMQRQYTVIPLYMSNGVLTVAMADPSNLRAIDILKFKTGKDIEPVIASEKSIRAAIERNHATDLAKMSEILAEMDSHNLDVVKDIEEMEQVTAEEGAQVVKIVNAIISQAILERASDIHLEPMVNHLRLRYRIDGELVERNPIPLVLRSQVTSRLKIMSGMDIAERRRPQDGRFQLRHEGRMIDIRISTFPTITRNRGVNEKVVMRVLDPESSKIQLKDIGFAPEMLKRFQELILRPTGIILVTGPTGSGKSTVLYCALQKIHDISCNIVTMEDPVEYYIDGISQAQINTRAGFTFAAGMRAILRQDPDVLMVGEMRDKETCEMAIQAALTGHLVLSTLHTNEAAAAYTRLMDMGIEPYLLTSTIIGVLAMRLLRRLCENCREEYVPLPEVLQRCGLPEGTVLFRPKGCRKCQDLGYKGRIGVFELLVPDETTNQMVLRNASTDEIRAHARAQRMSGSLRGDGLQKAVSGITSLEEVLATTPGE